VHTTSEGTMKQIVAVLVISGIVATTCSAYLLPEETHLKFEETLEVETQRIAEQAIQTGLILREVAQQLSEESIETEEYFFKLLWQKTKDAVRKAGEKIRNATNDVVSDLKTTIKQVTDTAKEKAREKALEVMAKIFGQMMSTYVADDLEINTDSIKVLCGKIAAAGSAYILPEEPDDNLDKAVEAVTKRIANEAIQTGFILREVAEELSKKFGELKWFGIWVLASKRNGNGIESSTPKVSKREVLCLN
ncbi:hypothetical protein V5799_014123, partial [Amblyomma americanum]